MDNNTLFDNYIKGTMSEQETKSFENDLKNDKSLSDEFRLYLLTVSAIIKEEEQDDIEFFHAMNSINKEELNEITRGKGSGKKISLSNYLISISSVAAVLVITMNIMFNIMRNNREDELIYAFNEPSFVVRGGQTIEKIDSENIVDILPQAIEIYEKAENPQEELNNGKSLAIIYIKLHKREKARIILQDLINKYNEDEDYSGFTKKLEIILQQIKD